MKFEVLDRFGKRIFWTEHESCVPDEETQAQLLDTGYRIAYNETGMTKPVKIPTEPDDKTHKHD